MAEIPSSVSAINAQIDMLGSRIERISNTDKNIGILTLHVFANYLKVQQALENFPNLKVAGRLTEGSDGRDSIVAQQLGGFGLHLANEFVIGITQKYFVTLSGPISGGDDFLLYHTDMKTGYRDHQLHEVVMLPETGSIEPELSVQAQQRLARVLQLTNTYYTTCLEKVPMAIGMAQIAPGMEIFPRFPSDEIHALRLGL
jgi:hypothetical protein